MSDTDPGIFVLKAISKNLVQIMPKAGSGLII
jgi:hypothetical protein